MKRFGGERMKGIMQWAKVDPDTPIENVLVSRAIADVQKRVEGYHFDMRKHLVEYDDVANKHREVIYGERKKILSGADLKANILDIVRQEIRAIAAGHSGHTEDYDRDANAEVTSLLGEVATIFPLPSEINASALSALKPQEIGDRLVEAAEALYEQREQEFGAENMRVLERLVMLRTIDNLWVEHLTNMEHMREGIGLVAVGQRDPLVAYKREGHELFQTLLSTIQHDVAHIIYHVNIVKQEAPPPSPMVKVARGSTGVPKQATRVAGKKVGRNDPCPCGSGKKYKHCCGK
jgi:preprotein translocase subunit SecA